MYQELFRKSCPQQQTNKPMQPTQPIFHPQKMRFKLTPRWNSSWLGNPHGIPLASAGSFFRCFYWRLFMDDFQAVSWCTQLVKKPTFQEDVLRSYRSSILWMPLNEVSMTMSLHVDGDMLQVADLKGSGCSAHTVKKLPVSSSSNKDGASTGKFRTSWNQGFA